MSDEQVNPGTSRSYLDDIYQAFEKQSSTLQTNLKKAETLMSGDASNPSYLAAYQARLQEYTLFRSAQSSSIKATKDVAASIIQSFR